MYQWVQYPGLTQLMPQLFSIPVDVTAWSGPAPVLASAYTSRCSSLLGETLQNPSKLTSIPGCHLVRVRLLNSHQASPQTWLLGMPMGAAVWPKETPMILTGICPHPCPLALQQVLHPSPRRPSVTILHTSNSHWFILFSVPSLVHGWYACHSSQINPIYALW